MVPCLIRCGTYCCISNCPIDILKYVWNRPWWSFTPCTYAGEYFSLYENILRLQQLNLSDLNLATVHFCLFAHEFNFSFVRKRLCYFLFLRWYSLALIERTSRINHLSPQQRSHWCVAESIIMIKYQNRQKYARTAARQRWIVSTFTLDLFCLNFLVSPTLHLV